MPRERIIHEQMFRQKRVDSGDENTPGAYTMDRIEPGGVFTLEDGERIRFSPALEVAWHRDGAEGTEGWVQVISQVDTGDVRERISWSGENEVQIGFPSEPMTRQQINTMIRTLRRARDAAFGSDE